MYMTYREANQAPLLDLNTETQALRRWQDTRNPEDVELLLRSHARLVHAIARRWARTPQETEDLLSAGLCGVLIAAERFDLSHGARFSSYARWWIQTMIYTEVAAQRATLSLPVKSYHDFINGRLSGREHELAYSAVTAAAPLDPLPGSEEAPSLAEQMASDSPTPEENLLDRVQQDGLRALLKTAIDALPSPAKEIMRLRAQDEPVSHAEIGAELGLSPCQVRAIEENAHLRLRQNLTRQGVTPGSLW